MHRKKPFSKLLVSFFSVFLGPFSGASAGGVECSGQEEPRGGIHDTGRVNASERSLSISVWGSSSAEGIGPQLAAVFRGYDRNAEFYNGGKGGETSSQTAARLGSIPLLAEVDGGVIPETGSVNLVSLNVKPSGSWKKYEATIHGVVGEVSATMAGAQFTRKLPGEKVVVPGANEVVPVEVLGHRSNDVILWMGKNDISFGYEASDIADRISVTCDWISSAGKRCLVIGNFNDSDAEVGGVKQRKLNELNSILSSKYGDRFVDVQALMVSDRVWEMANVSPSQDDLESQSRGQKPRSLSKDNGHMNRAGYRAVSSLIQSRLDSLGWYK
ncbi:SGNH/GDSL hydrolase family protein [Pseudomonas kurunegalensis]|uniref:SGNH/GDSL hydrolase family protein n=1 Tax=Pseudomonas kurunegalensis TaxID=485880 RepID=UPI00326025C5